MKKKTKKQKKNFFKVSALHNEENRTGKKIVVKKYTRKGRNSDPDVGGCKMRPKSIPEEENHRRGG